MQITYHIFVMKDVFQSQPTCAITTTISSGLRLDIEISEYMMYSRFFLENILQKYN